MHCRRLCPWHFPIRLEPAKVVEPYHIHDIERCPQSLDPPGVAILRDAIPPVNRIAPQLARRAEIIGRNTGHHPRAPIRIEVPKVWPRPNIRAVMCNVNRNIAHHANPVLPAYPFQAVPLAEEFKLHPLLQRDLSLARVFRLVPLRPGDFSVCAFQSHESREWIEPGVMFFFKSSVFHSLREATKRSSQEI